MEKKNYSLVSYLSGEEYKKVRGLQKQLSEITGSQKSLIDWLPHITLSDSIVVWNDDLPELETALQDFSHSQKALSLQVKGFGGTENWKGAVENKITSYVLWLEVKADDDIPGLFHRMREVVTSQYDTWLPQVKSYTPHITLAFADLSEEGYRRGMAHLANEKFETTCNISHVALVECYGEGNMTSVEHKRFYFEG